MKKTNSLSSAREQSKLIDFLVQDLHRPSESQGWSKRYSLYVAFGFLTSLAVVGLGAFYFPDRIALNAQLFNFEKFSETVGWILLTIFSFRISYLYSLPTSFKTSAKVGFLIVAVILFFATFISGYPTSSELLSEISLDKCPCGFYIALEGMIAGTLIIFVAQSRALILQLKNSAAWTFAAAGISAALLMHLFCQHHGVAHVLIWHILPIFALAIIGMICSPLFSRKT